MLREEGEVSKHETSTVLSHKVRMNYPLGIDMWQCALSQSANHESSLDLLFGLYIVISLHILDRYFAHMVGYPLTDATWPKSPILLYCWSLWHGQPPHSGLVWTALTLNKDTPIRYDTDYFMEAKSKGQTFFWAKPNSLLTSVCLVPKILFIYLFTVAVVMLSTSYFILGYAIKMLIQGSK